jgi:AraC-like DNA-binding protein
MLNVYDFLQSQDKDFRKLSFKDLLFVHYKCPQEMRYASFYTHLNYFLYVVEGTKIFHHPDRPYPLNAGTCAFIRKGGFVQERFFDSDWTVMAFFVPDTYLQDFVAEYRSSLPVRPLDEPLNDPLLYLHVSPLSQAFFNSMIPYFLQTLEVAENLVEMKFREMVFQLLSDPENMLLLAYLASLNERQQSLREIMEANFRLNLSLEEFARINNRSLSSFKREFLATYRSAPGKWLLQRRLEHAESLLSNGDKQVNEIADECGFESQTHFNRVFKQRFGVAPLQYRSQNQLIKPHR